MTAWPRSSRRYPDRFVGYAASLPMNAPEAAAREAERVLANGANAIQLHTNVDGAPIDQDRFLPIYEIIEKSGRPILLHPIRTREMADYRTEDKSKYEICSVIGWPFETGAALARLVFSGIMDRFPDLKVISHHLGGIIPYFEGRVAHSWDQLGARTSDEDYSLVLKRLSKRPFDYFKGFYGDTALAGARAPTICGISFFGADRVLFASDCPFDKEKGRGYIRSTIAVMESLDHLSQTEREKICHKNAEAMFGLRPSEPPPGSILCCRPMRTRAGSSRRYLPTLRRSPAPSGSTCTSRPPRNGPQSSRRSASELRVPEAPARFQVSTPLRTSGGSVTLTALLFAEPAEHRPQLVSVSFVRNGAARHRHQRRRRRPRLAGTAMRGHRPSGARPTRFRFCST